MAHSVKKPYYKDVGFQKKDYWKVIRREWKQNIIRHSKDNSHYLRLPKEIINDYNYCDYWFIATPGNYWTDERIKELSRK